MMWCQQSLSNFFIRPNHTDNIVGRRKTGINHLELCNNTSTSSIIWIIWPANYLVNYKILHDEFPPKWRNTHSRRVWRSTAMKHLDLSCSTRVLLFHYQGYGSCWLHPLLSHQESWQHLRKKHLGCSIAHTCSRHVYKITCLCILSQAESVCSFRQHLDQTKW